MSVLQDGPAVRGAMPQLLAIYVAAAEAGEPAPTIAALERALRRCKVTIAMARQALVDEGLIVTETRGGGFRVQIVATGRWTRRNASGGKGARSAHAPSPPAKKKRKCLRTDCRKTFTPTHKHNFICPSCSASNREHRLSDQWTYPPC